MKNNKRLGRGLEALIPQVSPDEEASRGHSLSDIDVAKIRANPLQPRTQFNSGALEDLKQSILENGVIQPITVRKANGEFELISGERRLRAVLELGYRKIPAFVMEVESDDRMLELALVENVQREDLNAIELAKAYERLQSQYGLTQEDVAKKVGKDRASVANFIRLLKLPEAIQESLRKDEITMGHAKALMGLPSRGEQMRLWKKSVASAWSVRKVEDEARKVLEGGERKKGDGPSKRTPHLVEAEDRLRKRIGTQIRIHGGQKGGKIEIDYYSADDLDRILELLDTIQG
jgi:ParB family transcriptional regulator, chromosome partitioning protein